MGFRVEYDQEAGIMHVMGHTEREMRKEAQRLADQACWTETMDAWVQTGGSEYPYHMKLRRPDDFTRDDLPVR